MLASEVLRRQLSRRVEVKNAQSLRELAMLETLPQTEGRKTIPSRD